MGKGIVRFWGKISFPQRWHLCVELALETYQFVQPRKRMMRRGAADCGEYRQAAGIPKAIM